jgi:hypothetical protein
MNIQTPDGKIVSFPDSMSQQDITAILDKQYSTASSTTTEGTSSAARSVAEYARPALEYGGMLMGGVLAAPTGPAGVIAGAGLGYAGGRQAANLVDQTLVGRKPQDMLTEVSNTGKDFVSGTTMEMGGGIIGNLIQKGGKAIAASGLPEWLYSKALKTPMGEAWKRTVPTKEWTKRERALDIGMKEEIKPNALGKNQTVNRIREIEEDISGVISGLKEETNVYDLTKALDPLKGKAQMARESSTSGGAIKEIETEVIKKGGVRSRLNPQQLQTLKQEFYKDIDFDKTKKILNENGRFTTDATKAIARKAMERLEEIAPELASLNKKQGAYIDLQKAIEHTIARYETKDAVGIGAKILSIKNVGLAALEVVTGTPSVKASLSFAIRKAGNVGVTGLGRPVLMYDNQQDNKQPITALPF